MSQLEILAHQKAGQKLAVKDQNEGYESTNAFALSYLLWSDPGYPTKDPGYPTKVARLPRA